MKIYFDFKFKDKAVAGSRRVSYLAKEEVRRLSQRVKMEGVS